MCILESSLLAVSKQCSVGTDCVYKGYHWTAGFPGGSVVKNSPANAGDVNLIPESGRSPGGGNGNPLQYSCLENSMDRGTW